MAIINFENPRTTDTIKPYLGKVLIFCEGSTEYNYFLQFKRIFERIGNKYNTVDIEMENATGNARRVLDYANSYLNEDENKPKYISYTKYLAFDCDAPVNIQDVICEALGSENNFELLVSNLLFETWLIMHFQELDDSLRKRETYEIMREYLNIDIYDNREKAKEGNVRKIVGNGESIASAIQNSIELENKYREAGLVLSNNIIKMNPYSSMHKIMESISNELNRNK